MLVQSKEQFDSVVDCLKLAPKVAVDTETNGLHVHKGHRLCGVSVHFEYKEPYVLSAYFPFRHALGTTLFDLSNNLPEKWIRVLGKVLARDDLFTVWHNAKFDFGMLLAEGIKIQGPFFCTMVASTLVNEGEKHDLGSVEAKYLGTTTKKETQETNLKPYLKKKKDYSLVPPAAMEVYANNDTRLTYEVYPPLAKELAAQEMDVIWPSDSDFLRCLFDMEWNGLFIDVPLAERLSGEAEARMRTLEDQMGFDPQKRAILADKLFLAPPIGLGLLAPTAVTSDTSPNFPQGLPVMDEGTLAPYKHPLIDSVLEYRTLVKANSTWYRGFLRNADPQGRIHPIYNTGGDRDKYGTVTGRLTSSGPNIQQLPRDPTKFVRKLLLPPPVGWEGIDEWLLVEFDYNQIEYRLSGVYADEPAIIDAYKAGSDMHQLTADKLGIPRVDPLGGLDGKKFNFAVLYGGGPERIADLVGGDSAEGKRLHNEFWRQYPNLRKLVKTCEATAKSRGWIRLWDGHRRHFNQPWEYHKAFNSLIQGGAARICQRSMLKFYGASSRYRMVYQVHDALGFYIPADTFEEDREEIKTTMEWPSESFGLDFPVDWKNIHEKVAA